MAPPRATVPNNTGRSPHHTLRRRTPPLTTNSAAPGPAPLGRERPQPVLSRFPGFPGGASDITSCRWRARGRKCRSPLPPLLPVSQVTFVRGPGCCFQLDRSYGSPSVLSLAQPQIPVHHCQLRGREGEGQSLDCHARNYESACLPRPRASGPAACLGRGARLRRSVGLADSRGPTRGRAPAFFGVPGQRPGRG